MLDRIINSVFSETLPAFKVGNDDKNNFILKTVKDDLLNYLIYTNGYPDVEAEELIVEDFLTRGQEAMQELRAWLVVWYSKWIERTQIISTKQFGDMNTRLSKYAERASTIDIPKILQYELEKACRETLINNKEYACTNIMSKDIVMYALRHEYKSIMEVSKLEDQLRLMTVVIRRTREIAYTTGKLVFIRARN